MRTLAERSIEGSPERAHALRKAALEQDAGRLARVSRRISTFRLVSLLIAIAIGIARLAGYLPPASLWVLALFAGAFVALVIWHARLDQVERRVRTGVEVHRWAMEKLSGRFATYPARGDRFASESHPYTSDLTIFGEGSVFQLLDETHTHLGETYLAGWLSGASDVAATKARQRAAQDLAARAAFREKLAVEGTLLATDKPNPEPFLQWAASPPVLSATPLVTVLAVILPSFAIAGLVLVVLGTLSVERWLLVLGLNWIVSMMLMARIEPVAAAVSARQGSFERYRAMIELIEQERFEAPLLASLRARLEPSAAGEPKASQHIRRLSTIVGYLDARGNEAWRFFIGPVLLWDLFCVLALERWQKSAGRNARAWLDVVGHIEALASLGAYAHDHPGYAFATLVDEPTFRARSLGHPLLDPRSCVRNDVMLREAGTALLVTGSNMSGKSTLLKAMGLGVVLAMAGAPVCAEEFEVSAFELRTSLWARDSLLRGVSHFYAELEKLKKVLDGIGTGRPLFFLLDEVLQGTNSRERFIGARSVLRTLLTTGAMGAVSTHDVSLLELELELDRRLDKVHFEEQVAPSASGGEMTFDYKLRAGVVRSTNALRLMKLVGIDVDLE